LDKVTTWPENLKSIFDGLGCDSRETNGMVGKRSSWGICGVSLGVNDVCCVSRRRGVWWRLGLGFERRGGVRKTRDWGGLLRPF